MSVGGCENTVDPQEAAREAGLVYVSDAKPGITRRRAGHGWAYTDAKGNRITDRDVIDRLNALAIPPAYTDVWICPNKRGHLQATGRDAKGRKQYRYHEKFREVRDGTKYEHMIDFAHALPCIRERIDADMRKRGLPREKVLATVVHLLETTMIRVGNVDYAKQNESYGLTTLEDQHVDVAGSELRFHFKGKSGKTWKLKVKDRRVARIVKASQELPGEHLFQYLDDAGEQREVTSGDVNEYLKEIAGAAVTAKDFRTWTGTVLAALALAASDEVETPTAAKRAVKAAIETVASRLGNTPTVCRKCYVHPAVIDSYLAKELVLKRHGRPRDALKGLRDEEQLVLGFLEQRLKQAA